MRPKIGDVVEIPLRNGKYGYAQYVHWDKNYGPLIQVVDLFSKDHVRPEDVTNAEPLFPPVITGLFAAVRGGVWRIIGNVPIMRFRYPNFVSTEYNEKSGQAGIWFLWDGSDWKEIGNVLPEKYQDLEFLIVWDPKDVAQRIETGEDPFPFTDLKKKNWFAPKITG